MVGLSEAIPGSNPAKGQALARKLEDFQSRLTLLEQDYAALCHTSPQRRELIRSCQALERLRQQLGLDQQQRLLSELLSGVGRGSGRSGRDFEEAAQKVSQELLLEEVGANVILTGVTLGAAQTEFDQLLVVRAKDRVEVRAVVEAKRNLNDLARGYQHRVDNLQWLQSGANSPRYQNGNYPTGRFEVAVHQQDGEKFELSRESFQSTGRPYLMTRAGTIWGANSAALGRMAYRVSTDVKLKPDQGRGLRKLRDWCQALTSPFETPELLEEYRNQEPSRILVLS